MLKIRKVVGAVAILAVFPLILSACTGAPSASPGSGSAAPAATTPTVKVALLCSSAGANDNGYNQTAINGLKQLATQKNIDYKVVDSTTDYAATLKTVAQAGYNLVFSLEYDFTALINGVGGDKPLAEQFPDTTFVVFNDNPNLNKDGTPIFKNVISVMFNVNESSFLAGALSVMVTENASTLFDPSQYAFTPVPDGRKIGFIGGTQSDGITVFSDGYAQGVNYAASQLGPDVTYTMYSTFNAGFTDTALGATTAGTYYGQGANVVFPSAGSVGDGVAAKAKEVKKLAIMVDANLDASQPGYILTSVIKNTNVPVVDLTQKALDGTLAPEGGKEIDYTLASNATGITDLSELGKFVKNDDAASAEWTKIKQSLADIAAKIGDGTIKVSNAQVGQHLDYSTLTNVKQG